MKRIIATILLIFISIPLTVNAADALYRMLHADEVEQFRVDQDALIVGQITEKKEDKFSVRVLRVFSGKVKDDVINVEDSFQYIARKESPKVHDFCFLSLKSYGSYYKKAWYSVKADSGDYRTLKLISDTGFSDLPAIEWYINSGGVEKDFSFSGGRAFVKTARGEVIEITQDRLSQKKRDVQYAPDTPRDEKGKFEVDSLYLIIGGIVIVSVVVGVFFLGSF